MIPILFAPKSREYNNNGLGVLVDVGYCTVTEERNGAFELELQYPVNGSHYSDLAVDCQILAKPNQTSEPQAFRIYNITKPMNGVVTVMAEHISYELSSVIVKPFSATSAPDALSKIKSNSIGENPFDFWTDKSTVANMSHDIPLSARSLLGGVQGSVLETYTGEYEFDNYTVKLHQNRGADRGVTISYAKNLTGVKCQEKTDGIVTGVVGYWQSEDENGNKETVVGDMQTVETDLSYSRNVVVDFSDKFEQKPTKEQLNSLSISYINSHKRVPYFSVSVEFVNLGDTEEYKQYKNLYLVSLCDTVTVIHPIYGINVKAKVIKTVFDSVNEKYEKIEIGEASANISKTIVAQEKQITQKVTQSFLEKAIANATNAITGNKGGYVVLNPPKNPQEILILDTPTLSEAENVWRWNKGGLGHSSTGYNGDFTTAITADGQIVADFITTGTLSADIVRSGALTSNNGKSFFSLETGTAQFGGDEYYTQISSGEISQHLNSLDKVGGLVPVGSSGGKYYEGLYYNSSSGVVDGVSIFATNGENILSVCEFSLKGSCLKTNKALEDIPYAITHFRKSVFNGVEKQEQLNIGISKTKENSRACICLENGVGGNETAYARFEVYQSSGEALITIVGCSLGEYTNKLELGVDKMWWGGDFFSYGDVSGSTITNRSDRKIKKNIKGTKTQNALSSVNSLKVYDYDLKDSGKSVKMGLMADEAPAEILSEDGKGINLYSYCGMLALAVKELSEKVDEINKNGGNYGRKD